jgi:hypothetical protein
MAIGIAAFENLLYFHHQLPLRSNLRYGIYFLPGSLIFVMAYIFFQALLCSFASFRLPAGLQKAFGTKESLAPSDGYRGRFKRAERSNSKSSFLHPPLF